MTGATPLNVIVPVCMIVVVLFALWALWKSYQYIRKNGDQDSEFFLTARNSQGVMRTAWGLYSTSVGARYSNDNFVSFVFDTDFN